MNNNWPGWLIAIRAVNRSERWKRQLSLSFSFSLLFCLSIFSFYPSVSLSVSLFLFERTESVSLSLFLSSFSVSVLVSPLPQLKNGLSRVRRQGRSSTMRLQDRVRDSVGGVVVFRRLHVDEVALTGRARRRDGALGQRLVGVRHGRRRRRRTDRTENEIQILK